jgi:hypothetical protein
MFINGLPTDVRGYRASANRRGFCSHVGMEEYLDRYRPRLIRLIEHGIDLGFVMRAGPLCSDVQSSMKGEFHLVIIFTHSTVTGSLEFADGYLAIEDLVKALEPQSPFILEFASCGVDRFLSTLRKPSPSMRFMAPEVELTSLIWVEFYRLFLSIISDYQFPYTLARLFAREHFRQQFAAQMSDLSGISLNAMKGVLGDP